MDDRQVHLKVVGVRVEVPSNQPVLILRGAEPGMEDHHVAIVVGPAEAAAVARGLQGEEPLRPMTHDLLVQALETLAGGVVSVQLNLLDSSTYSGTVFLKSGKQLDARASDAVAIAVRVGCPVTMAHATLAAVSVTPRFGSTQSTGPAQESHVTTPASSPEAEQLRQKGPISAEEIREFQKFLDDVGPEDFDHS